MNRITRRLLIMVTGLAILAPTLIAPQVGAVADADRSTYISDFDVTYRLGRDEQQRSTLEVTERITAQIPPRTNKGLVREIPREYDGHSVSFDRWTVTRNGEREPIYDEYTRNQFYVIETGTDSYIEGEQVFEFTYTMRDVTRYFENTNTDEFYWDVNGTAWRAEIDNITATLIVDDQLVPSLNGEASCYKGRYGSTNQCVIEKRDAQFTASANNLSVSENMSIAVGFAPGTFAAYEMTPWEKFIAVFRPIWLTVTVVTMIISIGLIIWFTIWFRRLAYRKHELGTIVPEYVPPKDMGVGIASQTLPSKRATLAAQLIEMAVRGEVQIIEQEPRRGLSAAVYAIQVLRDPKNMLQEHKRLLKALFGYVPRVGQKITTKKLQKDYKASNRMVAYSGNELSSLADQPYNLVEYREENQRKFYKIAKVLVICAICTLSIPFAFSAFMAWIFGLAMKSLTDKGLDLQRYLLGLKLYIKVAEADRIEMLQGPDTAEKIGSVDISQPGEVVKLYERALPYAMLFGLEKKWNKQLGVYYEQSSTQPTWYAGTTPFNAAVFSSMMSSVSSSVNSTSAGSSTTGGAGGGGFSGGGGGGGGGGFR